MENEENKSINFLEICLIRKDNTIISNWYRKSTYSGRFVHFDSHYPLSQKRAIVYGLVDKAINLSHSRFHVQNLNIVKQLLFVQNGYPFNGGIQHRLSFTQKLQADTNDPNTVDNIKKSLIVILYIKHLSYKLNSILSRNSYKVIEKPCNKLSKYIKLDKDNVDKFEKSDAVYKVNCADCKMSYIGQTGRQLRLRINEHKRSVKNGNTTSALAEHTNLYKHKIDFNKVNIVDQENYKNKRLFSEMLHIYSTNNNMNRQFDTIKLKNCYKSTVDIANRSTNICNKPN